MAKRTKAVRATGAPSLFPVLRRVVWQDPSGLATQDAKARVRCNDGREYIVKDDSKRPSTRHAEWFCTKLADLVGIAGPSCHVLEMPDGARVFGSQLEGAVIPGPPAPQWWELVKDGTIPFSDIRLILTKIYAFDHFIHNDDRHADNFLCCAQSSQHVLLAFDYSRAWTCQAFPLPALPFDESACATLVYARP